MTKQIKDMLLFLSIVLVLSGSVKAYNRAL
jgi:hypothetical protein